MSPRAISPVLMNSAIPALVPGCLTRRRVVDYGRLSAAL